MPGEGGAVSKAWMGEPSARKAKEIRKVESSRIIVCMSWREGGENSVGREYNRRENVDQRQ